MKASPADLREWAEKGLIPATPAHPPPAAGISEAEFTRAVVALARSHSWLCYHALPARSAKGWHTPTMGDVGFVDLVLCRNGVVIFAELKSATGRVRAAQCDWLDALPGALIWRPKDWSEIVGVLT